MQADLIATTVGEFSRIGYPNVIRFALGKPSLEKVAGFVISLRLLSVSPWLPIVGFNPIRFHDSADALLTDREAKASFLSD